jgi:hypothetical protein
MTDTVTHHNIELKANLLMFLRRFFYLKNNLPQNLKDKAP